MAHIAFVFCCFIWGSSFILVERVTHALGPVEIALWRFACGVAVLGGIWWWTMPSYRPTRREWAYIALIAVLLNAPPQIILPYLIHQGYGHSFFGPMVAPVPLITILLSVPLLGVYPTQRQLVGVLGGLACVWLIVDDGFDRGMSIAFITLTLLIPIASALSNTIIKWKLNDVPAVPLTAGILAFAGLTLAPLEFSPAAVNALHITNPPEVATPFAWLCLFILGFIATGISTAVFVWLIIIRGPLFAGMATYVVPVLALLWGLLDNERITPQQLAAIGGVLAMVALVQTGSRSSEVVTESAAPPRDLPVPEQAATLPLTADSLCVQPESQVA